MSRGRRRHGHFRHGSGASVERWQAQGRVAPTGVVAPIGQTGIKVIGQAGSTWWGKRWISSLERFSLEFGHRLERGREYAQSGKVRDLRLEGPTVVSTVVGSRPEPYEVRLSLDRIDDATWDKVIDAMASRAAFIAALLAGEMPGDIDQAFAQGGAALFPASEEDLWTSCTCPDWANPCKHVAAAHYVLADLIDRDPFVLFDLRGRAREDVMGALRRARGVQEGPASATAIPSVEIGEKAQSGYESPGAPMSVRIRIQAPTIPASVLRQIGPPPSWGMPLPIETVLGPVYEGAGALARKIAFEVDEEALEAARAEASAAVRPAPSAAPRVRPRKTPSLPPTITAPPVLQTPVVIRRKKVEPPPGTAPASSHRRRRRP